MLTLFAAILFLEKLLQIQFKKCFTSFLSVFLDKFIYGKILINIEKINKIGILKNENKKVMIITHTLKIESIRVMQTIFIFRRK